MNKKKVPKTDSIQELAHFWDTHDLTDFEDQLEEVIEPVFERKNTLKINLEPDDAVLSDKLPDQEESHMLN